MSIAAPMDDARVRRSCAALSTAMLDLLDDVHIPELTVSALCERAGVSRPTFYQHFGSIEDLMGAAVRMRLEEVGQPGGGGLAVVLEAMAAGRSTYGARLSDPRVLNRVHSAVCEWLSERIRTERPDVDGLTVDFAAGGATRLIVGWLNDPGPAQSADELAVRLRELVERVVGTTTDLAADSPAK